MSVCNKNQQNAHLFFVNDLIQSYCLRHLSNNQVCILRKTVRAVLWYFFHASLYVYRCIKKKTIKLHAQVLLRMNTWLFETC